MFLLAEKDFMILEKTQRFGVEHMKATVRTARAEPFFYDAAVGRRCRYGSRYIDSDGLRCCRHNKPHLRMRLIAVDHYVDPSIIRVE